MTQPGPTIDRPAGDRAPVTSRSPLALLALLLGVAVLALTVWAGRQYLDVREMRSETGDMRADIRQLEMDLGQQQERADELASALAEAERRAADLDQGLNDERDRSAELTAARDELRAMFPLEADDLRTASLDKAFVVEATRESCVGFTNCEAYSSLEDRIEFTCSSSSSCSMSWRNRFPGDGRFSRSADGWSGGGDWPGINCEGTAIKASWSLSLTIDSVAPSNGVLTAQRISGELSFEAAAQQGCRSTSIVLRFEAQSDVA